MVSFMLQKFSLKKKNFNDKSPCISSYELLGKVPFNPVSTNLLRVRLWTMLEGHKEVQDKGSSSEKYATPSSTDGRAIENKEPNEGA